MSSIERSGRWPTADWLVRTGVLYSQTAPGKHPYVRRAISRRRRLARPGRPMLPAITSFPRCDGVPPLDAVFCSPQRPNWHLGRRENLRQLINAAAEVPSRRGYALMVRQQFRQKEPCSLAPHAEGMLKLLSNNAPWDVCFCPPVCCRIQPHEFLRVPRSTLVSPSGRLHLGQERLSRHDRTRKRHRAQVGRRAKYASTPHCQCPRTSQRTPPAGSLKKKTLA